MCFVCRSVLAFAVLVCMLSVSAHGRELRVCADPNNLPFSNDKLEGFENQIAAVAAAELDATLTYTWWAHRRGFVRNTLKEHACDLVVSVPYDSAILLTTKPYYRSSYVFVTRPDGPSVTSLNDAVLREVRIGVQLIGDDGINTPPAHALARRGIVDNVRGFPVYGDYREPNPTSRIVYALVHGEIDIALAWGPLAGYFRKHTFPMLRITPIEPQFDGPRGPMTFAISMGVRKEDQLLRDQVETALERRRGDIDAILADYGVPRIDPATGPAP